MEPLLIYSWNPKPSINHHLDIVTARMSLISHKLCDIVRRNEWGSSKFCLFEMVQGKILLHVTWAKNNLYCPLTLNKWSTILAYKKTTLNLIWNNFGTQINILIFKNVLISEETFQQCIRVLLLIFLNMNERLTSMLVPDVGDSLCWRTFLNWKSRHHNDSVSSVGVQPL